MASFAVPAAIPAIKSVQECANYTLTISPYLDQIQYLPSSIFQHITNLTALRHLYITTNPVITGFVTSLVLSPPFLAAAESNQNYSQVDRFWSILPTLYNLHWSLWTRLAGLDSSLLDLRLLLSLVWSTRLTYNYWRRGGYQIGSEDYRWLVVKNYLGQPAFFLLDVLFISLAQNVLLFLVTVPSYLSVLDAQFHTANHDTTLGTQDYLFATVIAFEIAMTWLADQQQYTYQTAKQIYNTTARPPHPNTGLTPADLERGFRTTGLWSLVRHPNFLFEQSVWWTFYLWSSVRVGSGLNWSLVGPACYSLVFVASTPLTEYITSAKYGAYREYQEQVGVWWPRLKRGPLVFEAATTGSQEGKR